MGIGTTAPAVRLHVAGTGGTPNVRLESLAGTGTRYVTADASGNLTAASSGGGGEATTASNGLSLSGTDVRLGGSLTSATTLANGSNTFAFSGTGNVGVGTTSPSANLDVNGTARVRTLSATGTRMVTADATGNLGNAALPTDAQALSISGSTISLTNGGNVTVPSSADNLGNHTATQALNLAANKLVGNGGTLGLSIASGGTVTTDGALSVGSTLGVTGTSNLTGIKLPGSFDPDATYVGTTGNSISFGTSGISEDFIGYKNNTFYFADSPGGSDVAAPGVNVGGSLTVGGLAGTGSRVVVADASGNLTATATLPTGESTTAGNGLTLTGTQVKLGGTLSATTTIDQGTNNLSFIGTGAIGLGSAPLGSTKLTVLSTGYSDAAIFSSTTAAGTNLLLSNESGTGRVWSLSSSGTSSAGGAGKLHISEQLTGTKATFDASGNFGLGITSPAVRLHVAGTSGTSNVRLESLAGTGTRYVTADASGNLTTAASGGGEATTASNGLSLSGLDVKLGGTLTGTTTVAQANNMFSLMGGKIGLGTSADVSGSRVSVAAGSAAENGLFVKTFDNTSTANSLKLDHNGSNLIVRPASAGGTTTVVENSAGNLVLNPSANSVGIRTSTPKTTLDVAGSARASGAVFARAYVANSYLSVEGPDYTADNQVHTADCTTTGVYGMTNVSVYATTSLDGYLGTNCANLLGVLLGTGIWRTGPGTGADAQFHTVQCQSDEVATGIRITATGTYLDGNVGLYCMPMNTAYTRGTSFTAMDRSTSLNTGDNNRFQSIACPTGTFVTGVQFYADSVLEYLSAVSCAGITVD